VTDFQAHPKYEFKYGVKDPHTHDIKEQAEKRDGDRVEGYYKLVEPDGTTRTVHYTADKHNGFQANVEKSGHATHSVVTNNLVIPSFSHSTDFEHGSGISSYGSF
jgi:hypothetical protein